MDSPATARLSSRISAHLNSSKVISPDKMPRAISKFITHYPWSIQHKTGSSVVSMHNTVHARAVDIRWELPIATSVEFASHTKLSVPFTISVEDKLTPQTLLFHCRTWKGRSYRFLIERVSCYSTHVERDAFSSYKGPNFASLDPALQEAFDEVLHSWGMNTEVIDFIEASNQYYNNVEFVNWLCNINDFISK